MPPLRLMLRRRADNLQWLEGAGQSLVEFALLLPILLALLLGLIDTGMLLVTKSAVAYSCRQGARLLEQNNDDVSVILPAMLDALRSSGMNTAGVQSVTIYRANTGDNADVQAGNSSVENVYTYSHGNFSASDNSFPTSMRKGSDYVGVSITYRYTGFTPLYSGGFTIGDVTNVRMDPAGEVYEVATPKPPPTSPPAPPQPSPTPRPTYTPMPTYTPQALATATATTPANLTATAQAAAAAATQTASVPTGTPTASTG